MKRRIGLLLLILPVSVLSAADVRALVRRGNSFYHRQRFEEALSFYQQAEVLEPDNLGIHYNLGNTYYRLNRYPEAISELSLAMVSRNPKVRAQALYNLGNAYYRMGRLTEALNAYKLALLANPQDRQAKENFEFCLRQMQQGQQPDSTPQPQSGSGQQPPQSGQGGSDRQQQAQSRSQAGGQMDRQQAEQILQAVQNREREVQKRVRRAPGRRQVEKDW